MITVPAWYLHAALYCDVGSIPGRLHLVMLFWRASTGSLHCSLLSNMIILRDVSHLSVGINYENQCKGRCSRDIPTIE